MQKDLEISIELTNACPMRCIHCSSKSGEITPEEKQEELTKEEIFKILKDGKEKLGVTTYSLSGGEPLVVEHAIDTMRYAKEELSLNVILYTSGMICDPYGREKPRAVSKELANEIAKYIDKAILSIEGADKETFETVTNVKGSWELFNEALDNFVASGAYVECHIVPEKINWKQIPEMVEFCKNKGVKKVSLLRLVPQGRTAVNKEKLLLNKEEFKELNKMMIKLKEETKGIVFRFGNPIDFNFLINNKPKLTSCGGGLDRILIRPNGLVATCAAWKELETLSAGNIRVTSVDDIWNNSPVYKMFREFDHTTIPECKNCEFLEQCKGGCPAQRLIAYGDMRRKDPLCFKED